MKFTENLDPRTEEGYRNAIELLASAKKQMNSELGRAVANLFGFDSDNVLDSLYKKVDELANKYVLWVQSKGNNYSKKVRKKSEKRTVKNSFFTSPFSACRKKLFIPILA